MSRYALLFVFCILLSGVVWGQTAGMLVVSGRVVDEEGKALPYATAALTKPPFTIVKGVVTDEQGKFKLVGVRGDYALRIRMLGYSLWVRSITEQDSVVDMGTIQLAVKEEMLGMVTVQPLVEQTVDEIRYNLRADPDREVLNLHEILGKVPLIRHTPMGDLYVDTPDKTFLVLRNGKRDALFSGKSLDEILKAMPAKGFATVKVQLKPAEKYGAFDYVLDIETDESNRLAGVIGILGGRGNLKEGSGVGNADLGGSGEKLRYIVGVRGESFNVPVYRQRSEQHDLRENRIVERESKRRSSGESWEVGGELSYDFAKKHFISLKVAGGEDWKRSETSAWETKSTENEWLFAGTKARSSRSQLSASANYQWDIKPGGTTLNVVGQYTQKPQRMRNGARDAEEDAYLPSSITEDGEKQWILQVHYVNSLSPKFNLQVGGSYIYRDYDSEHILEGQGGGEPQALMRATLQFYSSYVKWAYRTKIFRLDIGAKFDYLNDGKGVYRKEQGFEQWVTETPFHCLPNAELSFFFPKKKLSRLGLVYAMTKNRPGLAFLSTRTDESNADYIRQNNVSLKSETMHRLGVNTSLFGLNLRIFGLYTPDAIRSYWYQNDAGELVRTYANTNKDYSLGGQIAHYLNWKRIACTSMFNTHYSYRRTAEENVKSALGYLSLNPTYTFKNKMALGATVNYMLYTIYSGMEGTKNKQPCSIGLNLRKKFLKQDCFEVELVCTDILHLKQSQRYEVNIDDLQLRQDSRQHCLPLSFRFSWRIGSFQVKPVKRGVRGVLIDDVKQAE